MSDNFAGVSSSVVTGWGVTISTTNDDLTAPSADILQEIVVPITSDEVCTAFVNTFIDGANKPTSWPSLLCVGTGEDNKVSKLNV